MKATLINFTPKPFETMCWAHKVMKESVKNSLDTMSENGAKDYFRDIILKDGMPTVLEYVNTVWLLEGVSRELQQQLTRHRIGFSYSIQSMRVVDKKSFADKEEYRTAGIANKHLPKIKEAMLEIQNLYERLLLEGIPTQDARSILPLGIHSTISFSCSLRALAGMINKRLCLKTQKEFRTVVEQMVDEIKSKMGAEFESLFYRPCDKGKCLMEAENEAQLKKGEVTGQQNTDHVCPLYKNGINRN